LVRPADDKNELVVIDPNLFEVSADPIMLFTVQAYYGVTGALCGKDDGGGTTSYLEAMIAFANRLLDGSQRTCRCIPSFSAAGVENRAIPQQAIDYIHQLRLPPRAALSRLYPASFNFYFAAVSHWTSRHSLRSFIAVGLLKALIS
jgi:hypothetical protein